MHFVQNLTMRNVGQVIFFVQKVVLRKLFCGTDREVNTVFMTCRCMTISVSFLQVSISFMLFTTFFRKAGV